MSCACFGELAGGVRNCWGYKYKVVRGEKEDIVDSKFAHLKNVRQFSFKELEKATNGFNNMIGKGGFSSYYRGTLEDGTVVAVQRPRVGGSLETDFVSIVNVMSRIRHRNVVELIGCCLEGDRKMLVLELVGEYSLNQLLFDDDGKSSELTWWTRASICLGVARGIEYLHQGINPSVVHRDIKPSNVVLDNNFNPKIVDFGIARLFDDDEIRGTIAGTYGYLDPEYVEKGSCTEKADVYGFGILLLEVITGKKNGQFLRDDTGTTLVNWVWELRESGKVMEIVDPSLPEISTDEVMRFIDVALFCVQLPSVLRPSMSEVLLMLSGGYDYSKMVLRKPEFGWSSTYNELFRHTQYQESGELDITTAFRRADSSSHESERLKGLVTATSTFRGARGHTDSESTRSEIFPHQSTGLYEVEPHNLRVFSLAELRQATDDFSMQLKIGEGGFGSVYEGRIKSLDGQGEPTVVAVRKLISSGFQASKVWLTEVQFLGGAEHPNLVKLIGYCAVDGERGIQRLLVHEYVPNKSLEHHLFNKVYPALPWERRMEIILGAAHGLAYLHEELETQVIFRYFRTSSILLDENFQAKLSDFGLARDGPDHSTSVVGTYGYAAPEYIESGHLTCKSDVWSFGVVLYEILSGRRFVDRSRPKNEQRLLDWVKQFSADRKKFSSIMDPRMKNQYPPVVARNIAKLADSCLVKSPKKRPTMSQVVKRLKQILKTNDYGNLSHKRSMPSKDFVEKSDNKKKQVGVSELATGQLHHLAKLGKNSKSLEEITAASSDSDISVSGRGQEFIAAASTFQRAPSRSDFESKSERKHESETEIESELETHSSAAELMQMSHDLETELYKSIESNIATAASASGPIDKAAVEPEIINNSSVDADILLPRERSNEIGKIQLSPDLQAELNGSNDLNISVEVSVSGPSDRTNVMAEVTTTVSAQTDKFVDNKAKEHSSPVESGDHNTIVSLPKEQNLRPVQRTIEKILEAFKDAQCRRICLHGLMGSGKTTVLESLFYHPATKDLFDMVIRVTVPRFAYQEQMQKEILGQLSLSVQDYNSEDEILSQLHKAFAGGKFLVLLDDVREIINLHEVGLPNLGPDSSCWLVFATRSLDFCRVMADREIEVEALSTVEAWEMFCCQVGSVINSPEIEPYARGVVETCHGFPMIILAVGSALRAENSVTEWEHAQRNLQSTDKSDTDNQCIWSRHIKFCYDRLKAWDVKICFLYSALFPEANDIEIDTLVECFINEGLLGGRTVSAYRRGHAIVKHLIEASLLEANKNGLLVKMHNVIKEFALATLSSDVEGYHVLTKSQLSRTLLPHSEHVEDLSTRGSSSATKVVAAPDTYSHLSPMIHKCLTRVSAQLKQPPSLEEWEQATMMFLMDNQLSSLPRELSCPDLVALFLQRNSCLRVIPSSFFDSMSNLKILNLSKTRIKSLPDSFYNLKNLRVLLFRDCERFFMLPSSIRLLKTLEVLDLQGTELSHLPDSVKELVNLKHLRVSFYGSVSPSEFNKLPTKLVSDGIVSSLEVGELGLFVYPGDRRWRSIASDITTEVSRLKLSSLCFHFPDVENLEYFVHWSQSWKDRDVTAFKFIVGRDFKRIKSLVSQDAECMYSGAERCLRFVNGEHIPDAVVGVLKQATSFYLDHHLSICSLSEFGTDSMNDLKICIVRDCPELVTLVNTQDLGRPFFPALEYLSINYSWNLNTIWASVIPKGSLARLRCLSVHACPKLGYVFTCSMLDNLPNLEELTIEDCLSLKDVVIEEWKIMNDNVVSGVSVEENVTPEQSGARGFHVLRNLKVLKLHYLPVLSSIWKGRWPPLEYISLYNCPELKNLHMNANDHVNIKEITANKTWWETLQWDDHVMSVRLKNCVVQIQMDDL